MLAHNTSDQIERTGALYRPLHTIQCPGTEVIRSLTLRVPNLVAVPVRSARRCLLMIVMSSVTAASAALLSEKVVEELKLCVDTECQDTQQRHQVSQHRVRSMRPRKFTQDLSSGRYHL